MFMVRLLRYDIDNFNCFEIRAAKVHADARSLIWVLGNSLVWRALSLVGDTVGSSIFRHHEGNNVRVIIRNSNDDNHAL